ncbi:MAG: YggT family protein [Nitriliruptoraceae bacterium]
MLSLLLYVYWWILILHVIFSWVPRPPEPIQPFVLGIRALVEPVARPIRRVLPPLQIGGVGLDLSILVLFFGVSLLRSILLGMGL